MKIENQDLIEEFYEKVKDEFPSITIEDTKDICFTPWRFLKQQMESGDLPEVRFKYFGTFQVYKGRAENMLYNLKQRFKFHKIEPKQYFGLKQMLENFLNNYDNGK